MPAPVSVRARDVSARRGGSERDRTTSRRLVSVSAAPSLLAYCWLAVRLVGLSLSSHMQIKCLPLLAIGVSSDMLCKSRHRAQTTAQSCSGAQPTPLATYIHPSRPRASAHDACFAPIWSCSSALAFQVPARGATSGHVFTLHAGACGLCAEGICVFRPSVRPPIQLL